MAIYRRGESSSERLRADPRDLPVDSSRLRACSQRPSETRARHSCSGFTISSRMTRTMSTLSAWSSQLWQRDDAGHGRRSGPAEELMLFMQSCSCSVRGRRPVGAVLAGANVLADRTAVRHELHDWADSDCKTCARRAERAREARWRARGENGSRRRMPRARISPERRTTQLPNMRTAPKPIVQFLRAFRGGARTATLRDAREDPLMAPPQLEATREP